MQTTLSSAEEEFSKQMKEKDIKDAKQEVAKILAKAFQALADNLWSQVDCTVTQVQDYLALPNARFISEEEIEQIKMLELQVLRVTDEENEAKERLQKAQEKRKGFDEQFQKLVDGMNGRAGIQQEERNDKGNGRG